jgi:hypothetical protein
MDVARDAAMTAAQISATYFALVFDGTHSDGSIAPWPFIDHMKSRPARTDKTSPRDRR